MEFINKFVRFNRYCPTCKNRRTLAVEDPCNECLTSPVNEHSHKPIHYEEGSNRIPGYPMSIAKKKPFFYETKYEELDYAFAEDYYNRMKLPSYGCSAVRNGNLIGRNFDWVYNNQAEFLVRVPAIGNHFASIGISSGFSALTDTFVSSGEPSGFYKLVPFQMVDGINENGVFAEVNVVPSDFGENVVLPRVSIAERINALTLVRFVLDRFKTAKEAVTYLQNYVYVRFPKTLHEMNYECHWLIADAEDTYVVEVIDNRLVCCNSKISTNFHVCSTIFNPDGTVFTPATSTEMYNPIKTNQITPHGSGLERWNLIRQHYDLCSTKEGMRSLMDMLTYTRAYYGSSDVASPFWYTEYVGGDNTVASPVSQLEVTAREFEQTFRERSRDTGKTWQSVHSAIYNIDNRSLSVITQEDGNEMTFKLE